MSSCRSEVEKMEYKKFRVYGRVVIGIMGGLLGYSVATGNVWLAIAAIIVGSLAFHRLKRGVKEMKADERINRIADKAGRRVYQIFTVTSAVLGALLITLDQAGYGEFRSVGMVLAFSACLLLLLYLVFYSYYSGRALE